MQTTKGRFSLLLVVMALSTGLLLSPTTIIYIMTIVKPLLKNKQYKITRCNNGPRRIQVAISTENDSFSIGRIHLTHNLSIIFNILH